MSMKRKSLTVEKMLFHYTEGMVTGKLVLSPDEITVVEQALESSPALRQEMEAIRRHITCLMSQPQPAVPADLTVRCIRVTPQKPFSLLHSWYKPALTLVVLALVFWTGIWFGQQPSEQGPAADSFTQLAQLQNEWIEKVEALYSQSLVAQTYSDDFWLQRFKATADWLVLAYEMNEENYNARQAISMAVYQNILVMQAMYQTMIENPQWAFHQMESGSEPTPIREI